MKASSSAGRYRVIANRPKTPTRAKSAHRSHGAGAAGRAAAISTAASIARVQHIQPRPRAGVERPEMRAKRGIPLGQSDPSRREDEENGHPELTERTMKGGGTRRQREKVLKPGRTVPVSQQPPV